jgi:O-antigen ligase
VGGSSAGKSWARLAGFAEWLVLGGLALALIAGPAIFSSRIYDNFTLPKQATLLVAAALVLAGLAAGRGSMLPRDRLLRAVVLAWTGWLVVAWALGPDPRGSLLGVYQYRQGLLTHFAYIVLFLGSVWAWRARDRQWLWAAGGVGLLAAVLYTGVQSLGLDPYGWWIDTSEQAIGTIGNANELAAFGVVAVGLGAGAATGRSWRRLGLLAGVGAAGTFIVLEAESKSGLIALGVTAVAYTAISMGWGWRDGWQWRRPGVFLGGIGAGLVLSAVVGGLAGTTARVEFGVAHGDSTRVALWEGTARAIAASPTWGHGPDGLRLAFPEHRPAGLGGEFRHNDLEVQSSHNGPLDVAASTGMVGLGLFCGMLAAVAARSFRLQRAQPDARRPLVWAALVGYIAIWSLNPTSMIAHGFFFVFLGMLAGEWDRRVAEPDGRMAAREARGGGVRWLRSAAAAPVVALFLLIAAVLPMADSRAQEAWDAYARGEFALAASRYASAGERMPIERDYAQREANSWLMAAAHGDGEALLWAEEAYLDLDRRFGLRSEDAFGLAMAMTGLGRPAAEIIAVVDRAEALNPHGVLTRETAAELRAWAEAEAGGRLLYLEEERRVIVVAP